MAEYDVSDISEVKVTLNSGQTLIYKGRGINVLIKKFRSLELQTEQGILIIDSDEPEWAEDSRSLQPDGSQSANVGRGQGGGRGTPKRSAPRQGGTGGGGGYNSLPVSYVPPKAGRTAHDTARDMQREAEAATGIKY